MAKEDNLLKGHKPTQFTSENQPTNRRQPSLKKQLAKVALSDGWITFEAKDVQMLEGGKVKVRVPKEEAMALKLFNIAMGKNPNAAMNAIKTYLETFDGKAKQSVKLEAEILPPIQSLPMTKPEAYYAEEVPFEEVKEIE